MNAFFCPSTRVIWLSSASAADPIHFVLPDSLITMQSTGGSAASSLHTPVGDLECVFTKASHTHPCANHHYHMFKALSHGVPFLVHPSCHPPPLQQLSGCRGSQRPWGRHTDKSGSVSISIMTTLASVQIPGWSRLPAKLLGRFGRRPLNLMAPNSWGVILASSNLAPQSSVGCHGDPRDDIAASTGHSLMPPDSILANCCTLSLPFLLIIFFSPWEV